MLSYREVEASLLVGWLEFNVSFQHKYDGYIRDEGKIVTFALCCYSNATRAPIANPPNTAQLGDIPYHSPKLDRGPYVQ